MSRSRGTQVCTKFSTLSSWVGVAVPGMLRTAMLVAPAALATLILGTAIEAGLMGVLVIRGRAAWRARGRHEDPLLVLGRIMPESSLPLATAIVSSELAVFYYSLLSWWRRPHVAAGMRPFSVHQRGGATAVLYVMAAMGVLETAVVHIVVHTGARELPGRSPRSICTAYSGSLPPRARSYYDRFWSAPTPSCSASASGGW